MTTAYPPHVVHRSEAVSPEQALELLQTYLADSESRPWLHPDATLHEDGPHFARTMTGGLTIHNLRRVEAGLRGERLGTDLSLAELSAETGINYMHTSQAESMVAADAGGGGDDDLDGGGETHGDGEWQDMDSYRRDQDVMEGELGKRNNALEDGGTVPRLTDPKVDKELRKRLKKERRKEERRKPKAD